MAPLAIWLLAVGLADCVSSFSGTLASRRQVVSATAAAMLVTMAAAAATGHSWRAVVVMSALYTTAVAVWSVLRARRWTPQRAVVALVYFGAVTVGVASSTFLWDTSASNALARWSARLPYGAAHGPFDRTLFVVGALVFLLATANALVRLALTALNDHLEPSEQPLRGGRAIGALERVLIFGLATAGEPTAAALVISAKSILRFPELNRTENERIDGVTEYFLVGSMASWLIALALVPFARM